MRYQIVEISWNKIYLNLKLNEKITDTGFQFFITTKKDKKKYPIKLINGEYFKINITSIADGDFLQNNEWYFKYSYNDSELLLLPFSIQSIDIAQLDKIYRYSGSAYAYIITFTLKEIDNHYTYCMNTTFMKKNTDISKRNYNIEYKRKKRRIKEYLFFLTEKFIEKIYHFIAKLHNKKGKNILLMSETRVPMNGNLKALYDKMMERELNKDYKIDLYFSKTNQKNYYKTLMKHVKIAIKAAKADYIFIDDFCSFFKYINPSKNTQIIQLWHAGLGFKDVGYGRFGESGSPHPIYTPHHKNDYIVVGSQELQNIYAEVFQCNTDRCLPYGLPRLDNYLNENSIDTFKKDFYHKYPYLKNKKIILFAPTFRGNSPQTAYYPIDKLNQDKIADICGDDYVFVLKFHPYIKKKFIIDEKYQNIIFDLSDFSDINFLFYVTEILITDYSSAIYEFSLFEKPILFYAFDEIEYTLTRGIHHSYKDNTPGKICRTLDDIYEAIKNQDFELEKVLEFKKKYHHNSKENSTDLIIDNLILKNKT